MDMGRMGRNRGVDNMKIIITTKDSRIEMLDLSRIEAIDFTGEGVNIVYSLGEMQQIQYLMLKTIIIA